MTKPSSEKLCSPTEAGNQSSDGGSSSGGGRFKGVRMRKWGKWVAEVRLPNSRERIWLGSYDTQEKAARAYDAAVFCLRGPGAQFNFPHDPPAIPAAGSLTPAQIQVAAARFAHGEGRDPVLTSMPAASTMHEVSHEVGMDDHQGLQGSLVFAESFMPGPCGGSDLGILGSSFEACPGDGEYYYPTVAEDDEEANVVDGAFFESPNLWSF